MAIGPFEWVILLALFADDDMLDVVFVFWILSTFDRVHGEPPADGEPKPQRSRL